jgi:hypothetical protein
MDKLTEILLKFKPDHFLKIAKDDYFDMRGRIRIYEMLRKRK